MNTSPLQRWAIRRHEPNPSAVTLDQRKVYILPTRNGLLLVILLLVMFLTSTNYGVSLGFMFTFLLTGLAAVTLWHTHRNLLGLTVRKPTAEPVFAGQNAHFQLALDCPHDGARISISATRGAHGVCADLPAGQRTMLTLPTPAPQRGRVEFGRLCLSTTYPGGLFRAWTWLGFDSRTLVYPRPAGTRALPLQSTGQGKFPEPENRAGRDDVDGLRAYVRGDPIRQIAWKATARSRVPLTKLLVSEATGAVHLDWLATPGNDIEQRLSQLSAWVLEAHRRGITYGLSLPRITIAPASGEHHRRSCLEALARFPGGHE